MNYRLDIDGLRTVAVFLVIFNHLGIAAVSGGFVGVDVFFVISGFLITSIIYPRIKQNDFSFIWFFSRRVKRLMPALFVVIFATTLVFSQILLPSDLEKYSESIIWVTLSVGNFFFWREHGGYFDGNSQEVPLLHTWSLAVEEQYYFVWPIFLILAIRFIGVRGTVILSIISALVLTWLSEFGTSITIGAAYYLLPTRFFELMFGSILAMVWFSLPKLSVSVQQVLSTIGIGLILYSGGILTEHSSFPGYNALYPVVGTCLLLLTKDAWFNKLLSLKPIVYTGKISYSLYLWHWPIITYFRYTAVELTPEIQLFCIVFTYALASLTYHFIEDPIRKRSFSNYSSLFSKAYFAPAAVFIAVGFIGIYQQGLPNRFSETIVKQDAALNSSSKLENTCISPYRDALNEPLDECHFGDVSQAKPKVFLIGDSHANHLNPFFESMVSKASLMGQEYSLNRCLPLVNLSWGSNPYKANLCKQRNEMAFKYLEKTTSSM